MLEKISNFFKNLPQIFKNAGQSMKKWPLYKKFDCGFWSLTAVLLITLIILFSIFATSMYAQIEPGVKPIVLTSEAAMQQDIVAAIALTFLVSLILSIFTLVIGITRSKKKGAK